jgi:hypothetical protein
VLVENLFDRAGEVPIGHSSSRCIEVHPGIPVFDSGNEEGRTSLNLLFLEYFFSSMKAEEFNGKNGAGR